MLLLHSFVAGGGVGPMSARTINGCAIKVKTDCKSAKLKGANLSKANLKGAVRVAKEGLQVRTNPL